MDVNSVLHGISAALLLGCAGVIVWVARLETRQARQFCYLIGLYFATKALDLAIAEMVFGEGGMVDHVIDFFNLIIVALMAISLYRGISSLRHTGRVMEDATREYRRAQGDYGNLIEHRLRNPMTVISSGAQTLLDHPDLDPKVQRALLENILLAAAELMKLSPDAHALTVEERGLEGEAQGVTPLPDPYGSSLRIRLWPPGINHG